MIKHQDLMSIFFLFYDLVMIGTTFFILFKLRKEWI